MLFFALILIATLLARLAGRAGFFGARDWPGAMRWGMAAGLVFTGVDHLVTPGRYLPMIPSMLPFPEQIVFVTGLCEIAGAIGLLVPQTRRLAGIMLAIYFIAVFPANIKNAVEGATVEGLPKASWYYWVRLLFQPLAIWWALRASEVVGKCGKRSLETAGEMTQSEIDANVEDSFPASDPPAWTLGSDHRPHSPVNRSRSA